MSVLAAAIGAIVTSTVIRERYHGTRGHKTQNIQNQEARRQKRARSACARSCTASFINRRHIFVLRSPGEWGTPDQLQVSTQLASIISTHTLFVYIANTARTGFSWNTSFAHRIECSRILYSVYGTCRCDMRIEFRVCHLKTCVQTGSQRIHCTGHHSSVIII